MYVDTQNIFQWGGLPNLTFVLGIHPGAAVALEVPGEVEWVGEGAIDPDLSGRVVVVLEEQFHRLAAVLGAPHIGETDPEHLLVGEVLWKMYKLEEYI